MIGIPIISDVLKLIDSGIDKIFPDADTKERIKSQLKQTVLEQAIEEKKLLFADSESARDLFKAELDAKNAPKIARFFQIMARPFAMYSTISMYVYTKISTHFDLPEITLNDMDYYLIGSVFIFLFGARTIEKITGKAKN